MHNISVDEILKLTNKPWISSGDLAKEVSERLNLTLRQAYNLIKKAVDDHSIRKVEIENGGVIYGLVESGPSPVQDTGSEIRKNSHKRQISNSERKRLEELAQSRAEIDLIAGNFPSLQPLKDLSDIYKEKRKELGLE